MTQVSPRVARPADQPAVDGLLLASYSVLLRPAYDQAVLDATLPLMTRANPALLSSGRYYVVEGEERLAGCGGWSLDRPGTGEAVPGLAHIRHFAVHPEETGKGIGRALYETCEAAARAAGARRFECLSLLNAEGFYAALGFATVRRVEVALRPGVTIRSLLMEREIG